MPSRQTPPSPIAAVVPPAANLAEQAHDRLEELLVTCVLPPGLHLSIQDLLLHTGVGRTPTHQAVSRLATDTLMLIRPRHGVQIAPIDLPRERRLLRLRRDMERFVARLAAERADAERRAQLSGIAQALRGRGMTIVAFNQLDRRIDRLLTAATGEPFLQHTLQPLHTIFRRIGWLYHSRMRPRETLNGTVNGHLAVLEAILAGRVGEAVAASDRLMAFVDTMFDVLEAEAHPALLDCNLAMRAAE